MKLEESWHFEEAPPPLSISPRPQQQLSPAPPPTPEQQQPRHGGLPGYGRESRESSGYVFPTPESYRGNVHYPVYDFGRESAPRLSDVSPSRSSVSEPRRLYSPCSPRFQTPDADFRWGEIHIGNGIETDRSPVQLGRNPINRAAGRENRGNAMTEGLSDGQPGVSPAYEYSIWGAPAPCCPDLCPMQPCPLVLSDMQIPSSHLEGLYPDTDSSQYDGGLQSDPQCSSNFASGRSDSHGGICDSVNFVNNDPVIIPDGIHPNGELDVGGLPWHNLYDTVQYWAFSGLCPWQCNGVPPPGCNCHQCLLAIVRPQTANSFADEDTLIIQGNEPLSVWQNSCETCNLSRELERLQMYNRQGSPVSNSIDYEDVRTMQGCVLADACDKYGCRMLQDLLEQRSCVEMIFNEIIHHVLDLMVNPFGNYLIQKLLDVCCEEQRLKIIIALTRDPYHILEISLNSHGTRVVQKLIETLKTGEQLTLVISSLQRVLRPLMKNLNGRHVILHCLENLSYEYTEFIFDCAQNHCVEIATDKQGCCTYMECMNRSSGVRLAKLIAEVTINGLRLAQDLYGNYVVSNSLERGDPESNGKLIARFRGNYVNFSKQKCSSNVVETCLRRSDEEGREAIIKELLDEPNFDRLMQDPYANYVLKTAVEYSKGPIHVMLVKAIRGYAATLKNNPFSNNLIETVVMEQMHICGGKKTKCLRRKSLVHRTCRR